LLLLNSNKLSATKRNGITEFPPFAHPNSATRYVVAVVVVVVVVVVEEQHFDDVSFSSTQTFWKYCLA
jgi:hypothetical protein